MNHKPLAFRVLNLELDGICGVREDKKSKKPLREQGEGTISFLVLSVHAVQPPTGENQLAQFCRLN